MDDIEVNDPLLEDDGENDAGIENEANDEEEKIQDDDTTDNSSDNSNE